MIIAFTAHRPVKLGGYTLPNPTYLYVCREISRALKEFKPEKIITGMALGGDQWAAIIAHKLGIPFMAAIPFERQESKWPEASQKAYRLLRKLATEEVIVCPGGYSADKMQTRNEFMVNNCDKLIAVYNSDPAGGTANCVKYAKSVNKDVLIIDPRKASARP